MPATADPIRSANPSVPVELCHNLEPDAFMWLWMKYVHGLNDRYHCTNCLRDWYGKEGSGVVFGQRSTTWKAASPKTTPDPLGLTRAGATVIGKKLLAGCLLGIWSAEG